MKAYTSIIAGRDPRKVVLMGDSAGGHSVACLLVRVRDAKLPQPAAAILLSAVTDCSLSGPSYRDDRVARDPMVRVEHCIRNMQFYLGTTPEQQVVAFSSPVFADLRGITTSLLVTVGTEEVLYSDAEMFAQNALRSGLEVKFIPYQDLCHCHAMLLPGTPEAQMCIDDIVSFARSKLNM
eukprot:TRINITY_DN3006_c0_g1_i1.p2 TRINITY_DN3006_c0_g1~~TRINITY_DN3006_c0_g1_i1.p2  ORF type:complete len:180 (-),score=48.41 TRINITY_DN3006_c0_g1_i1:1398-1937(-)